MRIRRTLLAVGLALTAAACALVACTDLSGLASNDDGTDAGKRTKDAPSGTEDDASGASDSPVGEARCDVAKQFNPPSLVTQFDATAEYVKDAVLSRDELEVFYLRYAGSGNWDLRHARRASRTAAWGTIVTEAVLPSPQGVLSLTAGDLRLYYWTIENNYRTTRASTNDKFGAPMKFDVASGPMAFFVSADDTAYFSKLEGDGSFEKFIRRSSVNSSGFSLTSVTVPNLHVNGFSDNRPVLNESETIMYLASNRPGGRGLDDVWVARRASKLVEFGVPVHVAELSTDEPDGVTWVSDDECVVYLYRASHVYVAQRPK